MWDRSENKKVLIIAEAGVNHNGDINIAKKLIDLAADAGADYVKFQTYSSDQLVTRHALKAEYQNGDSSNTQYEMLKKLELTKEDHFLLQKHCQVRNIGFLSTAFEIESLDFLRSLSVPMFKIPSGEITNLLYLRHLGSFRMPIILSTGMSSLGEIEAAINVLEAAGTNRSMMTVLHCTSEYPAAVYEVNLRAMLTIKEALHVRVGYSDHTKGADVSLAAVAMGAKVIEKHITLSREMMGPDHQASMEKDDFTCMVRSIRDIESALGDGIKKPTNNELKNLHISRKVIVASKRIEVGEIFTYENLAIKRSGAGLSPMIWDELIGKRSSRSFTADEVIVL